jgi:hypothetical protein
VKTTPINGMRRFETADAIDMTTQDLARMGDVDSRVVAHFDTKAAADAAYGAFTAQGGVLTNGMARAIGGYLELYRGGGWRGIQPVVVSTPSFFETTYNGAAEVGVATLALPDIGSPYYADVTGTLSVSANTGCQVQAVVRLDAIEATIASAVLTRSGQYPNGELMSLTFSPWRIGPITGTHNLIVALKRILGTGNWFVPAGGNTLRADITAA